MKKIKYSKSQILNTIKFWEKKLNESVQADEAMSVADIMDPKKNSVMARSDTAAKWKPAPSRYVLVDKAYKNKVLDLMRKADRVPEPGEFTRISHILDVLIAQKDRKLPPPAEWLEANISYSANPPDPRRTTTDQERNKEYADTDNVHGNDLAALNMDMNDSELNEADMYKVDDNYIKTALNLMAELKTKAPEAYLNAENYLTKYYRNKMLPMSAEEFAQGRIQRALHPTEEPTKPTQTRDELIAATGLRKKEEYATIDAPKESLVESIWVKKVVIDSGNENRSYALLIIKRKDGSEVEERYSIGTTGASSDFVNRDELYKQIKQQLVNSPLGRNIAKRAETSEEAKMELDKAVRIACIRVSFTSRDSSIQWFYGPLKSPDPLSIAERKEMALIAEKPEVVKAMKTKATKEKWYKHILHDFGHGHVIYKMEKVDDEV